MAENHLYLEPGEKPLGTAQAAAHLGVSAATVVRLFRQGRIQATKDWADRWRTTPAALRAYKQSSSTLPARGKAALKKFAFRHPKHGAISATRFQMRRDFGLDGRKLSKLIRGRLKTVGGWHCLGLAEDA